MEPKPLSFGDSKPAAPAPAPRDVAQAPGALVFKEVSIARANAPTDQGREPGALSFPPAAAPTAPRVAAPAPLSSVPPATAAPDAAPTAAASPDPNAGRVTFKDVPDPKAAATAARPAFGAPVHAAQSAAQARARAFDESAYLAQQERIDRNITKLLPFGPACIEGYAEHTLGECRDLALKTGNITRRFAQLNASRTLDSIVESLAPVTGVVGRLKRKFDESPEQKAATVRALDVQLQAIQREIREVVPKAAEELGRLTALLVALRAVSDATGTPADYSFQRMVEAKLDTLRMALQQALATPAHLKATQDTAQLLLAQCDTLQNVTLSAVQLAQARG